ncbi:MAG: adenosylcobinamide-GDP ribazoletransferase [Actinomycetes bacterium]
MLDALRLAVGLLTAVPVGPPRQVDRRRAGLAMVCAPAVGLLLGSAAALVMLGSRSAGHPALVSSVLAVAVLAALTRGLHLDGLADTADGLGVRRPAAESLTVMRTGDIGPFGVVTLVLVLLLQVTAAAAAGPLALLVAVTVSRAAVTVACRRGVPAARPEGLGALVASSVHPVAAGAVSLLVLAGATVEGWRGPAAAVAALVVAEVLVRHCVRRLGGLTGDVLGAVAEVAATVALLVLATG